MLSYQWDNQTEVKQLKEFLEEHDLKVWIDEEQMHGNIFSRMQEAINHSKVVVLCMSRKYELSDNCRLEFNYARKIKKINYTS